MHTDSCRMRSVGRTFLPHANQDVPPNGWQEGWSVAIELGSGGGLPRSCQDSNVKGQMDKGYALEHLTKDLN